LLLFLFPFLLFLLLVVATVAVGGYRWESIRERAVLRGTQWRVT
jgi:hypothetical protein